MSRALIAAKAGHGKSWLAQQWAEENIPSHDLAVVLDYKDEFRGLVESGLSKWAAVTEREADGMDAADWQQFVEANERVVLARAVDDVTWREVAGRIATALRSSDQSALVLVDEAHFIAPQRQGYPDEIRGLATTGRGERVSSIWVTQRLSELDETVIAQVNERILGGFTSDADLGKIAGIVDYPAEVHNPLKQSVRVPDAIDRDGQPLKSWEDRPGGEWIHSDDNGNMRRFDSGALSMDSTHYSPEGNSLSLPGEG